MKNHQCTEVCFQKHKTIAVIIVSDEEANELIKSNNLTEIHNGTYIKDIH